MDMCYTVIKFAQNGSGKGSVGVLILTVTLILPSNEGYIIIPRFRPTIGGNSAPDRQCARCFTFLLNRRYCPFAGNSPSPIWLPVDLPMAPG